MHGGNLAEHSGGNLSERRGYGPLSFPAASLNLIYTVLFPAPIERLHAFVTAKLSQAAPVKLLVLEIIICETPLPVPSVA
jgi:hypothetical protein